VLSSSLHSPHRDRAEPGAIEQTAAHPVLPLGSSRRARRSDRDPFAALSARSPLWVAAGPWSSGEQSAEHLAPAGAVIAKTVTAEPRAGNPPPVLQAWSGRSAGYLNHIGLRNVGAPEFVRARLPAIRACRAPLIQSFTAQTEDEVDVILHAFASEQIAGFELNASCPNAPSGQLADDVLRRVLRKARRQTAQPIWVKLAYAPAEILRARAHICADEGADALTAINTLPALAVTLHEPAAASSEASSSTSSSATTLFRGGVSGPTLTPLAQWAVDFLVREGPLPVVACGGVGSVHEVLAFAALGAAAVQVGSALLENANLLQHVQSDLWQVAARYHASSWNQLVEVLCPHSRS
jgi:dihydroorotate dehydrogenase (NAD+) catalytic subunit